MTQETATLEAVLTQEAATPVPTANILQEPVHTPATHENRRAHIPIPGHETAIEVKSNKTMKRTISRRAYHSGISTTPSWSKMTFHHSISLHRMIHYLTESVSGRRRKGSKISAVARFFSRTKPGRVSATPPSKNPLLQELMTSDEDLLPPDGSDESDIENQHSSQLKKNAARKGEAERQNFDILQIDLYDSDTFEDEHGDENVVDSVVYRKCFRSIERRRLYCCIGILIAIVLAIFVGVAISKAKSNSGSPVQSVPTPQPSVSFIPTMAPSSPDIYSVKEWHAIGDPFYGIELALDQQGCSVSMSDDGIRVAVGARRASPGGLMSAGAVTVYRYDMKSDTKWITEASFNGSAPGNQFGFSVAISSDGTRLAVGSIGDSTSGRHAGKVDVYERRGEVVDWVRIGNFTGENPGDVLGVSVALSRDGRFLGAGAPYHAAGGRVQSGSVYFWEDTGLNLQPQWKESRAAISGTAELDRFGWSIAFDETASSVIIGAPADGVLAKAGYAQVHHHTGNRDQWERLGGDLSLSEAFDRYGYSVSMSGAGTRIAVGAFNSTTKAGNNSGQVLTYEYHDRGWRLLGQVLVGENSRDAFGFSVAISNDGYNLAAGSPTHDGEVGTGMTQVFQVASNGSWIASMAILSDVANGALGYSVSLSLNASRLTVGTPNANYAQAYE